MQSIKQKTRLEAVEEHKNSSNAHVDSSVCMLFCCVHVTKDKSAQIKTQEDDVLLSPDPPGDFYARALMREVKTKQKYFM